MMRKKGYGLVMWVIVLGLIIAGIAFIRMPLKRAIQAKVYSISDYLLWGKGATPQEYQGEKSSISKNISESTQETIQVERKDAAVVSKGYTYSASTATDKAGSAGVEQGSEALLKTINMDKMVE